MDKTTEKAFTAWVRATIAREGKAEVDRVVTQEFVMGLAIAGMARVPSWIAPMVAFEAVEDAAVAKVHEILKRYAVRFD